MESRERSRVDHREQRDRKRHPGRQPAQERERHDSPCDLAVLLLTRLRAGRHRERSGVSTRHTQKQSDDADPPKSRERRLVEWCSAEHHRRYEEQAPRRKLEKLDLGPPRRDQPHNRRERKQLADQVAHVEQRDDHNLHQIENSTHPPRRGQSRRSQFREKRCAYMSDGTVGQCMMLRPRTDNAETYHSPATSHPAFPSLAS